MTTKNTSIVLGSFLSLLIVWQAAIAAAPRTASPEGVRVYFIALQDGDTTGQVVVIRFGLEGMGVAPAGVDKGNTGHHHLLIDLDEIPPMDQPIGKDEKHVHFGSGQTETVIELPPGKHTLQLLLGDQNHIPHDPPVMSEKITITVE